MTVIELEALVAALAESRLLTDRQLVDLRAEIDSSEEKLSGQQLVARLVEREVLTRWQARMLLSGRKAFFLGRYKLLKELGRGGMGAVFQAEHATLKRIVALKVMASQLLQDERAIARFHREIQAAAALDHPNIVAAYDAESVGETHFLVMEYVPGQTLEDLVEGEKTLPIATACEYIRQAALGLAHAHERGMAHRDIKPANLLVTSTADGGALVKVLDMGLARFASESGNDEGLTHTGQIMGTPDFIAPEQARNTKVADIRSDIFSLGCTLFRLLTGRVPYGGENVMEKLMARALEDAPRVRSLNPEVPAELDVVVAKMLARNPDARYQTPGELVAALDAWAATSRRGALIPVAAPVSDDDDSQEYILEAVDSELDSFLRHLSTEAAEDAETGRSTGQLGRLARGVPTVSSPSRDQKIPARRAARTSREPGAAGRRKTYVGLSLAATGVAMALGLSIWYGRQQATVVLDWPEADRIDAKLSIDGTTRQLAAQGELAFSGRPGKRVVKLEREGYELFEAEFKLSSGQTRVVRPEWKLTALNRRKQALAELHDETAGFLEGMTSVPEKIDAKLLSLSQRLGEFAQTWRGTSEENESHKLQLRLPVPLDTLRREQIMPADLRAAGFGDAARAPAPLVAVYGNRRFKHWNVVRNLTVSPDGKTVYSSGDDGVIRGWDRETGEESRIIDHKLNGILGLTCTADGRSLIFAGYDPEEKYVVRLLSLAGDREPIVMSGHRSDINAVAYSSQPRIIASSSRDGAVRIWDAETGAEVRSLKPHPAEIVDLALSPNAEWGASAGRDGFVRVWSTQTGDERFVLQFSDRHAFSVAFSHDGKRLAAGGGMTRDPGFLLKVWNAETGEQHYERVGPFGGLRFSPDDRYLAGSNADLSVSVLNAQTGATIEQFRIETLPQALTFADDGRTLVAAGADGSIHLWTIETGAKISFGAPREHPRAVIAARLAEDGSRLVSIGSDGSVVARDVATGGIIGTIDETFQETHGFNVSDVSPDGRWAAVSGVYPVHVWDVETGTMKYLQPSAEASGVQHVAFARNGGWLAIAAEKPSRLRIVKLKSGDAKVSFPLTDAGVASLAINPDGSTVITGMSDGATHVWSVPSGKKVATFRTSGTPLVALSPDGQIAATLGEGYLLQWWNTQSGSRIGEIQGDPGLAGVSSMAFHPAGRWLACSSGLGSVSIFDLEAGSQVEQIQIGPRGGNVWNVAFSPEGRHLLTANANGTVYVLRLKAWSPKLDSADPAQR